MSHLFLIPVLEPEDEKDPRFTRSRLPLTWATIQIFAGTVPLVEHGIVVPNEQVDDVIARIKEQVLGVTEIVVRRARVLGKSPDPEFQIVEHYRDVFTYSTVLGWIRSEESGIYNILGMGIGLENPWAQKWFDDVSTQLKLDKAEAEEEKEAVEGLTEDQLAVVCHLLGSLFGVGMVNTTKSSEHAAVWMPRMTVIQGASAVLGVRFAESFDDVGTAWITCTADERDWLFQELRAANNDAESIIFEGQVEAVDLACEILTRIWKGPKT